MRNFDPIEPIDYLVIGHVTQDIIPGGFKLGGTAAYAAKTAQAFGLRVGMVTSCSPTLELPELEGIAVYSYPSEYSSTFENIQTPTGRIQHIHHKAEDLNISMVPETWKKTPIVHLGPVCEEIDPNLARSFPDSMVGVTPQGWLRTWDANGLIRPGDWLESDYVLSQASAAVISIEDVQGDEHR
ncbi:MAG: ribokinase, partial [Anaerolineaceae bacterium]|nr:ribokinase [Anaerolineaceae bacterium]